MVIVCILLILFLVVYCTISWHSSAYRIERRVTTIGEVEYDIYGRWPNNLIWYGSRSTLKEAEERVKFLDSVYFGKE